VRDVLANRERRPVPLPEAWAEKLRRYLLEEKGG
jgi:hypothetical protein